MAHYVREACYKATFPHEQRNQLNINIYQKKVVAHKKSTEKNQQLTRN
jgi:hypothetical protein